jgi:RNA polymerase sigma factor (sigma-70 family)
MATNQLGHIIRGLRGAAHHADDADLTDAQLLDSYVHGREDAPFAALVRRHGPMVWGVCRRVLRGHQDAEDAFQATFLVLVRKAASVVPRHMVANWLYGVAYHTAHKARATAAKRGVRERQVSVLPEPAPGLQRGEDDLQPLLDQELSRLPDKYRAVLALCDLQCRTRKDVARQLNLPEGTVASRLAAARSMLAGRLARHGLPACGATLAAVVSARGASAGVPLSVTASTTRAASLFAAGQAAAGGAVSAKAVATAEAVLRAMLLGRLKVAAAVLVVLAALGAGVATLVQRAPADRPADAAAQAGKEVEKKVAGTGADWPQWRGPNRDGVVRGVTAPTKWPRTLAQEWAVPVGDGVASPVVVGDKAYVFARQKGDEVVLCIDLQGGRQVWRSDPYPARYKPGPGEGDSPDTPRSTPAVAGGRVFTLGITGILSCLDAATGKLLWRKDTRYGGYGGSSPLVDDGLCIAHVGDGAKAGGLTAFDAPTGDVRWCFSEGYCPMPGSPILVDLAGRRQLVTYSAWNAAGVSAATGQKLWGTGPGGGGMPCTTPVQYKDLLILADNQAPLRALRLERGEQGLKAVQVWKSEDLPLYYSSPVIAGDLVFGMSTHKQGCFFCLDAGSGKTLWMSEGRQGGYASLLNVGSMLLVLMDRGRLLVVKPSAGAFEPIADYRVSETATLAHPVFLGDRILIKDATTLRSYRVE